MQDAHHLIDEIRQIQQQYAGEVRSRRRPWPASIRQRIEQLSDLGMSFKEISERTKVPYYSIMNWRHGKPSVKKQGFHALTIAPLGKASEPAATVTVPIVAGKTEGWPIGIVTVTTPDGYQLRFEDARTVAKVLEELRGGSGRG